MDADHRTVLAHVGSNVRRLRTAAALTQDELAERAGTSRRTIINLEAGQANVSLSALDDLAAALGVVFVELVKDPTATRERIDEVLWTGRSDASSARLLASAPARHEGQLWSWTLDAGDRYDAHPDPRGWHEMILVIEGNLGIEFDSRTVSLDAGHHSVYSSTQHYSYVNSSGAPTRFVRVVLS